MHAWDLKEVWSLEDLLEHCITEAYVFVFVIFNYRLPRFQPSFPNMHEKAIFRNVILQNAILQNAILQNAILQKAILQKANLQKSILQKAILPNNIF